MSVLCRARHQTGRSAPSRALPAVAAVVKALVRACASCCTGTSRSELAWTTAASSSCQLDCSSCSTCGMNVAVGSAREPATMFLLQARTMTVQCACRSHAERAIRVTHAGASQQGGCSAPSCPSAAFPGWQVLRLRAAGAILPTRMLPGRKPNVFHGVCTQVMRA